MLNYHFYSWKVISSNLGDDGTQWTKGITFQLLLVHLSMLQAFANLLKHTHMINMIFCLTVPEAEHKKDLQL